ncbi:hypothetical protein CAC42_6077 [Sphaceloma murrayae]|uniref:Protein BIG1 n=1 Tax=Sphaceloma murrayae TaxID=2082308 RepID=A0A2K1QVB0_9PEZI|nr:hypothetical protein CAC42_6077 [Sphaceloma murrayae]
MRSHALALLAAAAPALAFRDTSPFFLFSSDALPSSAHLSSKTSLATAEKIHEHLTSTFHSCPSDTYILITQPNVSTADFRANHPPHLSRYMASDASSVKTRVSVRNVVGQLDREVLEGEITRACGRVGKPVQALRLGGGELPDFAGEGVGIVSIELDGTMERGDSWVNAVVERVQGRGRGWSVVWATTSRREADGGEGGVKFRDQTPGVVYEMEEGLWGAKAMHLKRDGMAYPRRENGTQEGLGLFEKYEFLSPGIFMGVAVSLLLLSILYVGLSAVSGLEVSYMAFSKEMNPAQKKQQQQ